MVPASVTPSQGYIENPRFMWRMAGVLFIAGATIGALSVVLPHPVSFDTAGLWRNIAAAYAGGVLCFLAAGRLPVWPLHLVLVAGLISVSRAIYLSGEASGFYTIFYIWIGLYVFGFFRRREAAVHLLAIGIAYAWVLALLDASAGLARWTTVIGTVALAGIVIVLLVDRIRRAAAESASLARERGELMGELEEVARTDELTGLPNRRAWNEEIARELARARRTGNPLTVGLLDIDRFKEYNDAHGHQAGDQLLKDLAVSWRAHLRATDILVRYGGEEFAVALPDTDLEAARTLVERLRAVGDEDETCSAGIAEWDGTEAPEELIGRADEALYVAKARGRDRVVLA